MFVKELIELLKQFDQDAEVRFKCESDPESLHVDGVGVEEETLEPGDKREHDRCVILVCDIDLYHKWLVKNGYEEE